MKHRTLLLVMSVAVPLMLLVPACTVNPNASATENAANAWNNPTTQQEVAVLTQIGTSALNAWLSAQTTKGRHMTKAAFVNQRVEAEARAHPNIPRAKIRATISAQLKTASG